MRILKETLVMKAAVPCKKLLSRSSNISLQEYRTNGRGFHDKKSKLKSPRAF
ncbi:hypothetical protein STRDD11_00876 [Streptococcus sp. DD11]|nr:hypothetical protein STRDD11_00876 [Streptococcus sp. DD11]